MSQPTHSTPVLPDRDQLRERLMQAGLRATQQRLAILEALVALPGHPTAEQVFRAVRPSNPLMSLGTIYKALDSFVASGLLKRVAEPDGTRRRYDVDCTAHHHLFCQNTQEIIDYSDPQLDRVLQEFFAARGFDNFQPHSFSLHISGAKLDAQKDVKLN